MRIGYSCWGFLGPGITDTPDGGRSHRRPFIDVLLARGHDVILLQANRDWLEAGDDLGRRYSFDSGTPPLDALFLEWRWPIGGRSTTSCGSPGHTCDLHRQDELLRAYTEAAWTPTVIWDKDRQLPSQSSWRRHPAVTVCEAALAPSARARQLLFGVEDRLLDAARPELLAAQSRPVTLAYAGNQYDRDAEFARFLAPAAAQVDHIVAGKWAHTDRWPQVNFVGRIPFREVAALYARSLATVLLLPARYQAVGQMTQRIFESVLEGCLPLAPASIHYASKFVPAELIISSGADVVQHLSWLRGIAGTRQHTDLIADCLRHLELFRLSRQVDALDAILAEATGLDPLAQ